MGLTCNVNNLSSICTSLVKKSAPIVALYWLLNFLFTYLVVIVKGSQAKKKMKHETHTDAKYQNLQEDTDSLETSSQPYYAETKSHADPQEK